jgi:hypothetical protein
MAKTEIRAVPFVSVNGIAFGTLREEVWQILGKPGDSFHKGDEDIETDIYGCFHVYYDSSYRFEMLEVVYVDAADIYYDGVKVPETYDGVLKFFKSRFDDIVEDGAGFISLAGSVGVYKETTDQEEYDTILFARKDYYAGVI